MKGFGECPEKYPLTVPVLCTTVDETYGRETMSMLTIAQNTIVITTAIGVLVSLLLLLLLGVHPKTPGLMMA
jgi:hypothetical protein